MSTHSVLPSLPPLPFRLGGEHYNAAELAGVAAHVGTDWSAVFGGTVRLGAAEWIPGDTGRTLVDTGGDWLLIVPMDHLPGPFLPTEEGFVGPLGADRIALAAWLLLAAMPCTGLPDVLLVPGPTGQNPLPTINPRTQALWSWPRTYQFCAGFLAGPAGTVSKGNRTFQDELGLAELAALPGGADTAAWLTSLRLPSCALSLGVPQGAEQPLFTWDDLGRAAYQLAAVAKCLAGSTWPLAEDAAVPAWETAELTPPEEAEERSVAVGQAQRGLPPWMLDSQPQEITAVVPSENAARAQEWTAE